MIISTRRKMVCIVQLLLLMVFATPTMAREEPDHYGEVMAVLDDYMDSLNRLDIVAHTETLHFPHFRHTSGDIVIWESAHDYLPFLDAPDEERKEKLRIVLGSDWDRSKWTRRELIQSDSVKVHVATRFARLRKDGSEIAAFESLYILTFEAGRWAIKGRSSFAPK